VGIEALEKKDRELNEQTENIEKLADELLR
jgi:hypothetical protein